MSVLMRYLEGMFREVRGYVLAHGYKHVRIMGANPKAKDVSTLFDVNAEHKAIDYLRKMGVPAKILTEESGEIDLASGKPEYVLIIDPVDGSTNLKKGIEGSAFCVAALPYRDDGKMMPSAVHYALIGSLVSGALSRSEKGRGVYYSGPFNGFEPTAVYGSKNEELEKACIEMDLDFALNEASEQLDASEGSKIRRILPLLHPQRKIKHVRRSGSAGLGLMCVPVGAVDAYIDVRDISTPENWMGAFLLVKESGGEFTDWEGHELAEVRDLVTPYSYVATGNPVLHGKILRSFER
jgi:fructose-1,6-bisphosphatase/inositol monophosphatase family enzyme